MKTDTTQANLLKPRWGFFIFLIVITTLLRLTPFILHRFWEMDIDPETSTYPWSFSAIPAIFIFCAAKFQNRKWSFIVPFSVLVLGDVGIGLLTNKMSFMLYPYQWVVYSCYVLILLSAFFLRKHNSIISIAGTGLFSAILFFLVTNFGVWILGKTYPMTLWGLYECYIVGLPFFRTSLISMAIFLPILFSPLALTHFQKEPETKIALGTF